MAAKSLAVLYRPKMLEDVVEQKNTVQILKYQIDTGTFKHAYLFCGSAGCGKTTCARIFAKEINKGKGNPIELDAASHNSVEDVRNIIQQAQTQSLDSEYKVFILDEVHAISSAGWQAMLKLIEEPPAKSIFIFCTTDPQKIPKTILSRVQRYEFKRISPKGIVERLDYILAKEVENGNLPTGDHQDMDAVEYIAKVADGGMRDAITLLDKCLSFSTDLTIENITKALGTVDYDTMFNLTNYIIAKNIKEVLTIIQDIHQDGKELKQFLKSYITFLLDVCKYDYTKDFSYIQIPSIYKSKLDSFSENDVIICLELLDILVKLSASIKWETSPKTIIESELVLCMSR